MKITLEVLKKIAPLAPNSLAGFVEPLNAAMAKYKIDTPKRIAMFLAQICHESGSFRYVRELASGEAYEGRKDLGNTQRGDGVKFKGRGLIQITGRNNYAALSHAFGVDFVSTPSLLETPQYAALSAAWFWDSRDLNDIADLPDYWRSKTKKYTPFEYITYRINGGQNGQKDREEYLVKAKKEMGII